MMKIFSGVENDNNRLTVNLIIEVSSTIVNNCFGNLALLCGQKRFPVPPAIII